MTALAWRPAFMGIFEADSPQGGYRVGFDPRAGRWFWWQCGIGGSAIGPFDTAELAQEAANQGHASLVAAVGA